MNDETQVFEVEGSPVTITVDAPAGPERGTVMMLAPFGMNSGSLFAPAYVMAHNGFRVLRVDPRNAPDGTAGAVRGLRLSRMSRDVGEAVDRFAPDALFAMSLSVPAAVRALRGRGGVRAASFVVPVVHVRATVREVCEEDWYDRAEWDAETETVQVLGHTIDVDLVRDGRRHGFETPDDTRRDLADVSARVSFVAGDRDPWVDIAEVRAVAASAGADVAEIPAAGHLLYRNPVLAMRFFERAAGYLLGVIAPDAPPVAVPPFNEIVSTLVSTRRAARTSDAHAGGGAPERAGSVA